MQGIKRKAEATWLETFGTCSLGQDFRPKFWTATTPYKITETFSLLPDRSRGTSKRIEFLVTMIFVGRAKACRYWPGTPDAFI
jgi:hypothetical protein